MLVESELLTLVDEVYAAALGEGVWDDALSHLADVLGHQSATLEVYDIAQQQLMYLEASRVDPDCLKEYVDHYADINPRTHTLLDDAEIMFDQKFMSEQQMDRDPFYMEFLPRYDLRYFLAYQTRIPGVDTKAVIALQRGGQSRGVDDEAIAMISHLQPHLNRSLGLFWQRHKKNIDPDALDRRLATYTLTPAERRLAIALYAGERLLDYAERSNLSPNTVYTHYRRLKDKLECRHQAEFMLRMSELADA